MRAGFIMLPQGAPPVAQVWQVPRMLPNNLRIWPVSGGALAALGQLEEENHYLERQWTLRRERARYEADRARRQYDAVEPENRLMPLDFLQSVIRDAKTPADGYPLEYQRAKAPPLADASFRSGGSRRGVDVFGKVAGPHRDC